MAISIGVLHPGAVLGLYMIDGALAIVVMLTANISNCNLGIGGSQYDRIRKVKNRNHNITLLILSSICCGLLLY